LRAATARAVVERVVELRRQRMLMAEIAKEVSLSKATVGRLLSRAGLSSLRSSRRQRFNATIIMEIGQSSLTPHLSGLSLS
jgi:orotate phosphoribosyltransferase-like protein